MPTKTTPVPVILLMGCTGSGKTTFINTFLEEDKQLRTGDDLESVTQDIASAQAVIGGREVMLVDTPGFDDTFRPEMTIAATIADWLAERYSAQGGAVINGIIYMRDIRKVRMTGTDIANRTMFEKLIGEENFKNVRLMTSFWPPSSDIEGTLDCEKREGMLMQKFWRDMAARGSTTARFNLYD
ncbi:uncharacterized protein LACBIDRAFT_293344 [Laccaria bicolor S238N-H82]|uniref:Predicted protein n=1 Tax=Laccaria bicolor (strain S238N-H82 / ATCC MYA-4686) TaxID=486041 RepID=B0D332_LACBS|nr:uncharacterized protein LACBIDRAFT_293344 [Laccaria bicolor S238N-H82]EDR11205.1 predicted protein [Laccaria bicolor S238N-H82]|eukprot:XP_001878506.1 predicted protein [Laccaria bicolor S238N-H82]